MTCFFHLLFSIVLLFNVSACQAKTKIEKAKVNMTDPIVSEPLTKPIKLDHLLDLNNRQQIESEYELRKYLIETYKLPHNWEKKITQVTARSDKKNRVIAITLDGEEARTKKEEEQNRIIYMKENQENFPFSINSKGVWRSEGSYMSITSNLFTKETKKQASSNNLHELSLAVNGKEAAENINKAIVQQQKIDKLSEKNPELKISLKKDKKINKVMEEKKGNLFLQTRLKTVEMHQYIRETLLHSKAGAVIILHQQHSYRKPVKSIKVRVPEFKSRGFRIIQMKK
ncbi:hypothetical protein [Sutcliffiella halmapala]|uniref:hypothetical protein n=1 Tax=Sutcliffiella halmapala TaxID=79882 RepID=UPI000994ED0D|nr:hypothetical protein [Sutcliffiella halmapala]